MQDLDKLWLQAKFKSAQRANILYTGVGDVYNIEGKLVQIMPATAEILQEYVLNIPFTLSSETDKHIKDAEDKAHRIKASLSKLNADDLAVLGLSHLVE